MGNRRCCCEETPPICAPCEVPAPDIPFYVDGDSDPGHLYNFLEASCLWQYSYIGFLDPDNPPSGIYLEDPFPAHSGWGVIEMTVLYENGVDDTDGIIYYVQWFSTTWGDLEFFSNGGVAPYGIDAICTDRIVLTNITGPGPAEIVLNGP